MTASAWVLIGVMCSMTAATFIGVWWSWKNGQFDAEAEDIKHRMLHDE